MRLFLILALVALSACKEHPAEAPPPPTVVAVPVTVSCLSGDRPATVKALQDEHALPEWNALTVRQKSALVVAKGMERQTYGDRAAAVTAGCK
jgi:hypothetical protein